MEGKRRMTRIKRRFLNVNGILVYALFIDI